MSSEEEVVETTTEAKRKQQSLDAKKAEVRKRLEEQSQKKQKKGFMTPERKKKLRLLLRKKAAEELKKEQERKASERRKIIDQRCGQPKILEGANEETLKQICKEYHERLFLCESQKWDLEYEVRRRDYEINELNIQVNDLRGKFIKPTLKKVSKYENKFAKLQKKAAEFNFRNQLKTVKKKEFELDDDKDKIIGQLVEGVPKKTEGEQQAEEVKPQETTGDGLTVESESTLENVPTEAKPESEGDSKLEVAPETETDGANGAAPSGTEADVKPSEGVADPSSGGNTLADERTVDQSSTDGAVSESEIAKQDVPPSEVQEPAEGEKKVELPEAPPVETEKSVLEEQKPAESDTLLEKPEGEATSSGEESSTSANSQYYVTSTSLLSQGFPLFYSYTKFLLLPSQTTFMKEHFSPTTLPTLAILDKLFWCLSNMKFVIQFCEHNSDNFWKVYLTDVPAKMSIHKTYYEKITFILS
ncbi:Troponin I [Armadillidium vulgare]|nr:Troponin I [Armadillidium vulgare]